MGTAPVRHFEEPTEVGGLLLVEEEVGLRRVGILITVALEEAQGDERVEKVARRTRVESQTSAQGIEIGGTRRELGEESQLDGAEECFRGPEGQTGLQNLLGIGCSLKCGISWRVGRRPTCSKDRLEIGNPIPTRILWQRRRRGQQAAACAYLGSSYLG